MHLYLTAGTVVLLDGTTVTIRLTEAQRVEALYHSATPGGDGTPVLVQTMLGAFKDVGQNPSLVSDNITVTETADTNLYIVFLG